MTIKEISNLCNVSESTIRNWIDTASTSAEIAKPSAVSAGLPAVSAGLSLKIREAQETKKPADFTLPETLAIIRAGGNKTLAALLEDNARNADKPQDAPPLQTRAALLREVRGCYEAGLIDRSEARTMIGLPPQAKPAERGDAGRQPELIGAAPSKADRTAQFLEEAAKMGLPSYTASKLLPPALNAKVIGDYFSEHAAVSRLGHYLGTIDGIPFGSYRINRLGAIQGLTRYRIKSDE